VTDKLSGANSFTVSRLRMSRRSPPGHSPAARHAACAMAGGQHRKLRRPLCPWLLADGISSTIVTSWALYDLPMAVQTFHLAVVQSLSVPVLESPRPKCLLRLHIPRSKHRWHW
jgi:hypothetical protein